MSANLEPRTHPRMTVGTLIASMPRDPLLHFLALGALVYGVHVGAGPTLEKESVTVPVEKRQELAALFGQRHGRTPTAAELHSLVDAWVEDELLLREGLELDLVRKDPGLREQLVARTRSLLASAETPESSDAEITAFYEAHRAEYARPRAVSFTEYLFRAGSNEERLAQASLRALRAGERIPHVPMLYEGRSEPQLVSLYGEELAAKIVALEPDAIDLLRSKRGLHLIQMKRVSPPTEVPLTEVRSQVARDLALARQRDRLALELRRLKAEVRVTIEGAPP